MNSTTHAATASSQYCVSDLPVVSTVYQNWLSDIASDRVVSNVFGAHNKRAPN